VQECGPSALVLLLVLVLVVLLLLQVPPNRLCVGRWLCKA